MTAFRATFSDMKLVKTRQVAQLIFEIPMEEFDAAYEVLGGLPNPSMERWFGIAAIVPQAEKESKVTPAPQAMASPETGKPKRGYVDLPPQQQAGMRISDPVFCAFLKEQHPDEWHETGDPDQCLKMICGDIQSKRDLEHDQRARVIWHQLDSEFQAWRRVGA